MAPPAFSPGDEQAMRQAIAERPDAAQAHAALASFLCAAGRADEALAHLDRERLRRPSSLWPLSIKAGILSAERRTAEAIDVHRALVAMAPDKPLLWSNFAGDLAAAGDAAGAAAAYRRAVEMAPGSGAAWLGLANLRLARPAAEDVATIEQAVGAADDPYQKMQMLFALGRFHDAFGAFDRSFTCFSEANSLRERLVPHDASGLTALVDAQLGLPGAFFAEQPEPDIDEAGAIFIVGMPRSGSTLVEQVLDCHPEIEGGGELFALQEIAASLGAFEAPASFARRVQALTRDEAAQLRTHYRHSTARFRKTKRRYFIDKMPANWRFVTLIQRILPNARIIDVRRDPMACCFSAYTTYFNRHTDFPNELEHLGQYFGHYVRTMDMARTSMPKRVYRMEYEELVAHANREIRALLEFLQRPFSDFCLRPQENPRAVHTPSAQQVREPVHRSKNRVRNYLPWLEPLRSAIESGHP